MEKINISFKGMTNIPDDSFSGDGDMAVVLNMRHKGGELVQCQPPAKESAPVVKQAMFHAKSGKWLELHGDGELWLRDGTEAIQADVESFAIMGNVVIMYRLNKKPCYLIWRGTEYVNLGQMPEPPKLEMEIEKKEINTVTSEKYYAVLRTAKDQNNEDLYNEYVQKGFIDECLNNLYKNCGYVDRALFVVALRLFDGSYICSNVYYSSYDEVVGLNYGVDNRSLSLRWTAEDDTSLSKYKATVIGYVPTISLERYDHSIWRDLIVSVNVFTSGSIMSQKAKLTQTGRGGNEVYLTTREFEAYERKEVDEIRKDVAECNLFYKIAEYDLKGVLIDKVEDTSPSYLSTMDNLGNTITHSYQSSKAIVYNSRLHVAGRDVILDSGYSDFKVIDIENKGASDWITPEVVFSVRLDTDNGVKVVTKRVADSNSFFQSSGFAKLSPLLTYPDSRAFQMDIWMKRRVTTDGSTVVQYEYRKVSYPLAKHRFLDMAYYLNGSEESTDLGISFIRTDGWELILEEQYNRELVELVEKNIDEQKGILSVSAVDNPFYFPSAQTYKFDAEIVGVASNAEAISTGQFGQYPLFVFTKSGIWAMAVDASGQGAYTTMSPFSREVCSGDICPVSGGVVFTAKRGLMAISGGAVTELSAMVDGRRFDFFGYNQEMWNAIFGKAGVGVIAPDEIRTYIDGAKLGYNYLHNEVIVSNSNYGYSFVFSLSGQEWSVIDSVFDVTTNSYPELVVYDNKNFKRLKFKDEVQQSVFPVDMARIGDAIGGGGTIEINTGVQSVVAVTRPIKMGTLDFKRIRQAALRCTFTGALNFYVLGSNDGARFVPVTGKEYPSVGGNELTTLTRRDLVTAMSRSKQYRYIVIAVAGKMRGRVSMAELLVDGSFTGNKLR